MERGRQTSNAPRLLSMSFGDWTDVLLISAISQALLRTVHVYHSSVPGSPEKAICWSRPVALITRLDSVGTFQLVPFPIPSAAAY